MWLCLITGDSHSDLKQRGSPSPEAEILVTCSFWMFNESGKFAQFLHLLIVITKCFVTALPKYTGIVPYGLHSASDIRPSIVAFNCEWSSSTFQDNAVPKQYKLDTGIVLHYRRNNIIRHTVRRYCCVMSLRSLCVLTRPT